MLEDNATYPTTDFIYRKGRVKYPWSMRLKERGKFPDLKNL